MRNTATAHTSSAGITVSRCFPSTHQTAGHRHRLDTAQARSNISNNMPSFLTHPAAPGVPGTWHGPSRCCSQRTRIPSQEKNNMQVVAQIDMQEQNVAKICCTTNAGHASSVLPASPCQPTTTTTHGITQDWPVADRPFLTSTPHFGRRVSPALCGKKANKYTAITHLHENTMQTQGSATQCSSCLLS
jgi:hypothetical protein